MYDLIGDIHGHASELTEMLDLLGYRQTSGVYRHPERQAVFLGDFIDRGPQIKQVLEIVRPMVEAGTARAVIGNHELNALAYHTPQPDDPEQFVRPHNEKNDKQHRETLRQLSAADLTSALNWFRTLPLWLDLGGVRAVHACWDEQLMDLIQGPVDDRFVVSACQQDGRLFEPVEAILKGKEASLPAPHGFHDKDGHFRKKTRVKWFLDPDGHTFGSYALATDSIDCPLPLPNEIIAAARPYPADSPPVFVGHYWLSGPEPKLLADNVACLDWSVAKGGYLCCYRWSGEQRLDASNFVRTGKLNA